MKNSTIRRRTVAAALALATGCGVAAVSTAAHASPAPSSIDSVAQSRTQTSAATYADRMVRAWGSGDHSATRYYTTHAVHRTLFGQADPGGAHWRRTHVEGAAGTTYVTYHDDALGGTLVVRVSNVGLHDGNPAHSVYAVTFRNEPRTVGAVEWSDRLVRAWGSGHHGDVGYYATPGVARALFKTADPGGTHWARIASDSIAGTTYVTYQDTVTSDRITIGVDEEKLSGGRAHAANHVEIW